MSKEDGLVYIDRMDKVIGFNQVFAIDEGIGLDDNVNSYVRIRRLPISDDVMGQERQVLKVVSSTNHIMVQAFENYERTNDNVDKVVS